MEHDILGAIRSNHLLSCFFNDAKLARFVCDYSSNTIVLDIFAIMDEERMAKHFRVVVLDVAFMRVVPAVDFDTDIPDVKIGSYGVIQGETVLPSFLEALPNGCWANWIYFSYSKSQIDVVAKKAVVVDVSEPFALVDNDVSLSVLSRYVR